MDRNASMELRLTDHAHEQYCDRVEPIDHAALYAMCLQQLRTRDYSFRNKEFIHLAGIWWVHNTKRNRMSLVTCYGRTKIDIPRALKWARHHDDWLNLKDQLNF